MNYQKIIDKYYKENDALRNVLLVHSHSVALKALAIVDAHPELHLDRRFVEEAAMIHDIGIFRCNAPGIHCHGTEPYICHGPIGAEILRAEGFPEHARVCERHTGSGITLATILERNLPLPHMDLLPETLEEKVVCYADKFFSKTKLHIEKTYEQAEHSLEKFGADSVERFRALADLFGR
ncbi:MAG: HDIG domain-containing protein [Prevotella sp.]|nr:HDIG domain-containing protein [Prevotella sp.]MBQ9652549.1 HDIG domain-containing protein [Prevotella sp.]